LMEQCTEMGRLLAPTVSVLRMEGVALTVRGAWFRIGEGVLLPAGV
jgi:hypothetical protein